MYRVSRSSLPIVGRRPLSTTVPSDPIPRSPLLPLPIPDDELATIQRRLNYTFANRTLLEDALTHISYPGREKRSYKSLKELGKTSIRTGLRWAGLRGHLFDINFSSIKLARIAMRARLYHHLRHKSPKLDRKVADFIDVEEGKVPYNGIPVKVPRILPHLVLSSMGAVTVDQGHNIFSYLRLGSHFMPHYFCPLGADRQMLTTLECVCFDYRMSLDLKKKRERNVHTARVFINNILHGSHSSTKESEAEGVAAIEALIKLPKHMLSGTVFDTPYDVKDEVWDHRRA